MIGIEGLRSQARQQRVRRSTATLLAVLALLLVMFGGAEGASAAAGDDRLSAGEQLTAGQRITSQDKRYSLVMQSDGNLVVVGPGDPTWSSNTGGSGSTRVVMQGDGNLVTYTTTGVPVFANGRTGAKAQLVMQNDGNLVEYTTAGATWWTDSPGERAIQWYYNRMGRTDYEGRCERAAEDAYGNAFRYATARDDWNASAKRQPYSAAPRDALVFYSTSSAGHVAISIGNGKVVSTSANHRIGVVPIGYFQNPLGWDWTH